MAEKVGELPRDGEYQNGSGCEENHLLEIFGMCKSRSFQLLRVKKKVQYEQRHEVLKTHTEDFWLPGWIGEFII